MSNLERLRLTIEISGDLIGFQDSLRLHRFEISSGSRKFSKVPESQDFDT